MKPNDLFNLPIRSFINELNAISTNYKDSVKSLSNKLNEEYFSFIPYNPEFVFREFSNHLLNTTRFIDVGCGAGIIMALVKYINPYATVSGLEIDEQLAKDASKLFGFKIRKDIIVGDAFNFKKDEKVHCTNNTLLYYYHPIANNELMKKLYVHMSEQFPKAKHLEMLSCCTPKHKNIFSSRMALINKDA